MYKCFTADCTMMRNLIVEQHYNFHKNCFGHKSLPTLWHPMDTGVVCAKKSADENVAADLLANDSSKDKTAVKVVENGDYRLK
jgi:hypothetical protein